MRIKHDFLLSPNIRIFCIIHCATFLQKMRSRIIRADNEDAERANVVQASIDRGFHSTTAAHDLPRHVRIRLKLNVIDILG